MQSRLFHAVVAAGLSLGAASVASLSACSDPSPDGRHVEGAATDASLDTAAPADADIYDSPFEVRYYDPDAHTYPERDAAADVDGDAGWPTTK
ncbi:MAG: hypothetical protein JWM74_2240 [Myxococcaceae bacterium]|nr:hypothetical protein [Myxococcaceae bacterium]